MIGRKLRLPCDLLFRRLEWDQSRRQWPWRRFGQYSGFYQKSHSIVLRLDQYALWPQGKFGVFSERRFRMVIQSSKEKRAIPEATAENSQGAPKTRSHPHLGYEQKWYRVLMNHPFFIFRSSHFKELCKVIPNRVKSGERRRRGTWSGVIGEDIE